MRNLLLTIPASVLLLIIVGGSAALVMVITYFIRSRVPEKDHVANNEVAGYFLGVMGVVYGVLLAFLVLVTWQAYEDAQLTVEQEANTVVNIYRFGQELPEPYGTQVRNQVADYVRAVIDDEWPKMAVAQQSDKVQATIEQLWLTHRAIHQANLDVPTHEEVLFDSLEELGNHRRIRLLASRLDLPYLLWVLLIGGAIVTIGLTFFLRAPNWLPHLLMAGLFAALIAFVLFLIVELDNPFAGEISVRPIAFEQVLELFRQLSGN